MRGNALADPTVVGLLQPFIVTFWYGHRDDDQPDEVNDNVTHRTGRPGPKMQGGMSNVKAMVLDPTGECVEVFDSMPERGGERGPMGSTVAAHFEERLRDVCERLGLKPSRRTRDLVVPGDDAKELVLRTFVRLDDRNMKAYNAPVVEVEAPSPEDWRALAYPKAAREVDASALFCSWKHAYPPGVMERQDKTTYVEYRVARAEGTLDLRPAGTIGGKRCALLTGRVKLTDEGPDDFSWEGEIQAVLTYSSGSDAADTLRGSFEAEYTRYDAARDFERKMPLVVVIESLPLRGTE